MAHIEQAQRRHGAVWLVRYRHDGRSRSRTFADRKAAERWRVLVEVVGPVDAERALLSEQAAAAPTLGEHLEHHLEHLTGVSPRTLRDNRQAATRSWLPTLGALPVDMVTRDHVARWVRDATDAGLAPKTIKNLHGLLSSVLASAVEAGHRPDNPARGLRLPRGERQEMVLLSRDAAAGLVEQLPTEHRPLVLTLLGTGLRWSEATALQWRDVVLDDPTPKVRVSRAWSGTGAGRELAAPKTDTSRRTVTTGERLAAVLADHRPRGVHGTELVFRAARGGQLHHQAWHPRVWRPAVAAAALDPVPRVHDLRHTHASWLIADGVPLPVIQRRLGHRSIQTTVDVYGHLEEDAHRKAATAVDHALDGLA